MFMFPGMFYNLEKGVVFGTGDLVWISDLNRKRGTIWKQKQNMM